MNFALFRFMERGKTPRVLIRLLGPFWDKVGEKTVNLEGETVEKVMKEFLKRYGHFLIDFLNQDSEHFFRSHVLVLLNDANIDSLDGMNTPLKEGDVIALTVSAAGG